MELMTLCYS